MTTFLKFFNLLLAGKTQENGETTGGKKTMKRKGKVLSCRKIKDTTDKL